MTIIRHLAAGVLTALALTAGAAPDPIRIAVTAPFTGSSSPMGLSMRAGVRVAADEINLGGGIFGRRIELVERDDKDKVVAGLGVINTGVSLAAQRFYQEAKIPVINNVATGAKITQQFILPEYKENYVFRTSASDVISSVPTMPGRRPS